MSLPSPQRANLVSKNDGRSDERDAAGTLSPDALIFVAAWGACLGWVLACVAVIVAKTGVLPFPALLGSASTPKGLEKLFYVAFYLLGSVSAFYTVVVKPRVNGQLLSMDFKEGDSVREGQPLATIDPQPYQSQLVQAEAQLTQDEAQFAGAGLGAQSAELKARIATDRAKVENAKLQIVYTKIASPINGVLGLRMVDPGNMVQAESALVVITQLQPIAVLFTVPEDNVQEVRARLSAGASPSVEAWDRTNTNRIAAGHLTAIDNEIDETTGTIKLKAIFDNKDGAMFPNQFVNVHLFLK